MWKKPLLFSPRNSLKQSLPPHACKKPDNGLLRAVLWKPVCLCLAKGKDFQQELVGWCPGRWGLAALEPGWSPCSGCMPSPPLPWGTREVSVLHVRADGVTASSVCLRSTAARIQVTRGSRSKSRQSGVFIAVTHHISKLCIDLVLALLQKSDMMPAQVSHSVLKIRWISCALWQRQWHQILSSSMFSNAAYNLNSPGVAFFLIPGLLSSL